MAPAPPPDRAREDEGSTRAGGTQSRKERKEGARGGVRSWGHSRVSWKGPRRRGPSEELARGCERGRCPRGDARACPASCSVSIAPTAREDAGPPRLRGDGPSQRRGDAGPSKRQGGAP